ncbi:hypothetical protein CFC35_12115 [Streptomyces sp. FBKL.4005]|uniref:CAP domain-containing protein n=1 Tax=Streptomyces sp. FBKL.4005 TaxID=2015515 RepID=UPI000B96C5F7|nr:CAP domain-containing protein [Streptomyces sp. FBKL.4005]OYP20088.1 hypothetical protein CFC35_12115 [Streptomyces sp. FBKL.4005]
MGRHRRSAAGRAATGRATGAAHTQGSGSGSGREDTRHPSSQERQIPMGTAPYLNPEAYAEATAKAQAYLFAKDDAPAPAGSDSGSGSGSGSGGFPGSGFTPAGGPSRGHRRRNRSGRPVRAGLLGVSAAVALGTVAVTTGMVPGLDHYQLGGGTRTTGGERVQTAGSPSNTAVAQGGTSGGTGSTATAPTGGGSERTRPASPSAAASPSASASKEASRTPVPSKTPARKPAPKTTPAEPATPAKPAVPAKPSTTTEPAVPAKPSTTTKPAVPAKPSATAEPSAPAKPRSTPSRTATGAPAPASSPVTVSREAVAEAEVLKLVNEERAKVGCSPLAANSSLTKLAESFSDDMAARGFFGHTDPDGRSPWDRAAAAGITSLGGENIARGQADAAAVMESWMNSPGHRANILNCDFKTLGVGVHFGPGGPWWTQDFGY